MKHGVRRRFHHPTSGLGVRFDDRSDGIFRADGTGDRERAVEAGEFLIVGYPCGNVAAGGPSDWDGAPYRVVVEPACIRIFGLRRGRLG